jgi:hypothetical protein
MRARTQEAAAAQVSRPTTANQIAEARLFSSDGGGMLLRDIDKVIRSAPPQPPLLPGMELDEVTYFHRVVCESDAVVLAQTVAQRPFVNEAETFVFTENDLAVTRWLRGERHSPVPRASTLVTAVTRGGRGVLDGRVVEAVADIPLAVGRTYLLFLRQIPGATSFQTSGPISFDVDGPNVSVRNKGVNVPARLRGPAAIEDIVVSIAKAASTC